MSLSRQTGPRTEQQPGGLPASLLEHQARMIGELDRLMPPEQGEPGIVRDAMRYTLLAPSKRVRGILALLCADLCGHRDRALSAAAAIELVHAASLILDDLPSMDDAALRRGQPANHARFGEAVAILAAFGLLNLGFAVVADGYDPPLARVLAKLLSDAVGTDGLIGGQAEDLLVADTEIRFETLERIHRRKTGALFVAAATAGSLAAGGTRDDVVALAAYAKNLGLAFQIVDDILDVEGGAAATGKTPLRDAKRTTFVSFSGIGGARQLAGELCATADTALNPFGERARALRELSAFVASRRG